MQEATDSTPQVTEIVARYDLGFFSFLTPMVLTILTYVCMAVVIGLIVLMIVKLRKLTDRNARRSSSSGQPDRQAGHILPVDAFDFDEPSDDAHDAPEGDA